MNKRRTFDWNATLEGMKENKKVNTINETSESYEFKPTFNQAGTSTTIIRFLPMHPEESVPYVLKFNHGFYAKDGKFIYEECPTSISKPCPICEDNRKLWNIDEPRARERGRKQKYFANILIVKSAENPELNGQVMTYQFGYKIYEKIKNSMQPQNEIEKPVFVFDYEKGADFLLQGKMAKATWAGGKVLPTFDASKFLTPAPIALNDTPLTDSQINEIDAKLHRLETIIAPSVFKDASVIKARIKEQDVLYSEEDIDNNATPKFIDTKPKADYVAKQEEPETDLSVDFGGDDSEETTDDFFARLANQQ